MANLSVDYMGIRLRNPLIASSSPLTATVEGVKHLADAGIGGVVLKSIFEEQIAGEASMLGRYNDYPEAADYLHGYVGAEYVNGFTELVAGCKRETDIPVIASINCVSDGRWVEFARTIADAGADALELNIFFLPSDAHQSSSHIEKQYLHIVRTICREVDIPVSIKLGMRFTNIVHMAQEISNQGAHGAVLFNRFFEPDIDIDTLEYIPAESLSAPTELFKSLRYVAITSAKVPGLDLSVSTGVHTGADVVKSILVGARAVQLCTAILRDGMGVIGGMTDFLGEWMDRNGFETVEDFRGLMNSRARVGDPVLERVQYMKTFPAEIF